MASVLASNVIMCPATTISTTKNFQSCLSCFSECEARSGSYGRMGSARGHFETWSACRSSSQLSLKVHRRLAHRCYRTSSDFFYSMNARKEPLGGSSILAGLDHAVAMKRHQAAVDPSRQFISEERTADYSNWNVWQRLAVCALAAAAITLCGFLPKAAHAVAENSIGASSLGLKVAEFLRRSGLSDELVVLTVAMLPVLELRGAIPVSYWLKLEPVKGYVLAVIGNMIPVPFIVLYLEKMSNYVGEKSELGRRFVRWVFERTRRKAGPIEEFQWLGLLLFVAVPLPGTGAWTGAIAASILGMSLWDAMTANLLGVMLAGLLVNLIVSVGARTAFLVGIVMLGSSVIMWNVLRVIQQKKST